MSLKTIPDNPAEFPFQYSLTTRMSDLAGGLHVANHMLVAYITEAQMAMFRAMGFSDLKVAGAIPVNQKLEIGFFSESAYNDELLVGLNIDAIENNRYSAECCLLNTKNNLPVAKARLQMVFIDYQQQKRIDVPQAFIDAWKRFVN